MCGEIIPFFALSFDGVNDFVYASHSTKLNVTTNATFEAWVNIDTYENYHAWIYKRNGGANTPQYRVSMQTTNKWGATWNDGSFRNIAGGDISANIGSWVHFAVTVESTVFCLYKNGVLEYSTTLANTIPTSTGLFYLGRQFEDSAYWDGKIADIRIWNTTRTGDDINSNKSRLLTGNESGLVLYYPINEGSGNTLSDATTNGLDGTIDGASWERVGNVVNGFYVFG